MEKLAKDNICSCKLLVKCTCQGKLVIFPFTLPRKTCQGKTCQGELASVNETLFPEILIKYRNLFLIVTFLRWPTRDMLHIKVAAIEI